MLAFGFLGTLAGLWASPGPDVVIGCSVHPCAALAGLSVARMRRARFFVEVPDLWPQVLIDFGRIRRDSVLARSLWFTEKLLYDRAERIVMLWRNTQSYVRSRGVSVDKLVWIPHVVDPANYPRPNFHSEPLKHSSFCVMYVGSFVQSTALDVLLDAASILSEKGQHHIRLILIGGGVDRPRIIARAHAMGLTNVEIRDPVPKKDVAAVLQQADCFVCCIKRSPVYSYGVSMNKVCDYLMSGKPVIFSGESAYDPIAEAQAGISVAGEDPEALAGAMTRMSALSADERHEMGRRGVAWVRNHHDIELLTDRLEGIITGSSKTQKVRET
jgi:glycosyltransferase involved in cell wall biosynthesis